MPKTKDYNIRVATLEDVFELTLLAREAYEGLKDKDVYTFSSKKVGELVLNTVGKENYLVLVLMDGEELVGYFFSMIVDCFFALEKQTTCISWFIRPEHRGLRNALSLLKVYEKWGKDNGSVTSNMINVKMGSSKVYEKLGYTLSEETYVKRIK